MEKKPNEEKKQPEQNENTESILRRDKFREDLSGTTWYKPNGEKIGDLDAMLEWKKKHRKQKS